MPDIPRPGPVGRTITTISHAYIHTLQMIGKIPKANKIKKYNDWIPNIQMDPLDWERRRLELTPHTIGYIPL
eukprot:3610350-Ditylum_brightwellii.AAC.2